MAMQEVDPSQARSADELQAQWHAALRRHGIEPRPRELRLMAELVEAGRGPRHLLPLRYGQIAAKALGDLRRFLDNTGSDD